MTITTGSGINQDGQDNSLMGYVDPNEASVFLEFLNSAIPRLIGRDDGSLHLGKGEDLEAALKFCDQNFLGVAYVIKNTPNNIHSYNKVNPKDLDVYRLSLKFEDPNIGLCVAVVVKTSLSYGRLNLDDIQIFRIPEYKGKSPALAAESVLGVIPSLFETVVQQWLARGCSRLGPGGL